VTVAFTVRVPTLADAATTAELLVATWRETYAHLLPEGFFTDEFARQRHDLWRRILTDPRDDVRPRVAEVDGVLVGLALAGPAMPSPDGTSPRPEQLYQLYVAAAHHGTGVGQALLEGVLGDRPAMLWVARENPRAIAFYRRNGFELDGAATTDPGAPGIVEVRMVRPGDSEDLDSL
jgi:ribosomal protein S18 acetylase RimI-like enzyme